MYKVMVVDDEALGRKAICKMIGELSLDVEVIAEARHGEEALELIELGKPHIVVTDMNMPVMNGLHFLKALHERYGHIFTIVISGYSQFEYLQAAIKYQACDYLLKPVALPELRTSLIKAMEQSRKYMTLQQQRKESREIGQLKRSVFLQNVTGQRIVNKSDIAFQAKELQIGEMTDYRLVVMRFRRFGEAARTKFHGNADLLMFSIENILHELLQDEAALVYKSDDRQRICLIVPEELRENRRLDKWLADFQQAMQRMLKLDVLAGVSGAARDLAGLPEAYREANQAITAQALKGVGLTIALADEAPGAHEGTDKSGGAGALNSFDLQAIRQAFAGGNAKESRRLLEDYMNRVGAGPAVTIARIQAELSKIMEAALSELKGADAAFPPVFDPQAIAAVLDEGAVYALLKPWISAIQAYGETRREPESAGLIDGVVRYLEVHYFEDVSLIDVATRFHMDPSYLSKLFKMATNENFIEYVTRKRIEKACELLVSSDRRISDISELVGYENQRYFSQVFKKSIGFTPSEYREAHLGSGANTKN
ncbi:response regulator [Paenibacillus physcomitrellae]|uniref:AraC family transcriptional regulator n=1 Tax=Paenibacillus physcomitrellae TaxID=1619311 RepID=A0ABQ1G1R8_9BACL|nr:response regulator [Paenibacillus physcomitrellae]GGA34392.1 AraC family transcriptional regulator [Paenibacillus physcomitrellae]